MPSNGSKTNIGAGAGVYGAGTKCSLSLGSYLSVFQAEILAIEEYVEVNLERNYQSCGIAIHSDSQAAIKALSSHVIECKLISEFRRKPNEVLKNNRVWVPGHSGIK